MSKTGTRGWLVALAVGYLGLSQAGVAATDDNLWSRLAQQLVLNDCPSGSRAEHWAQHYAGHPQYLNSVIARARPWLAFVISETERRGLAGEVALLPIVESGYDAFAFSHRGAAGHWQLLTETAEQYGVNVNEWYDGRRAMHAATDAALGYLEFLHRRLDNQWDLAIAAYNAGPGRVSRSLRSHGSAPVPSSWEALSLPGETRIYLSKIQGLSCLIAEPDRYGPWRPAPLAGGQLAVVPVWGPTDVIAVATHSGLDPVRLLHLNAGLRRHVTPPDGPHQLIVPADTEQRVRDAVSEIGPITMMTWSESNARRGDTLTGIARRHRVSPLALKQMNDLETGQPRIGQRLLVPSAGSRPGDPEYARNFRQFTDAQQALLPENRYRHQVRPGEDLWALSQRYSVSAEAIRQWNGLSPQARIGAGQLLEIPPGHRSLKPHEYQVQDGDTLWSIAKVHGVTVNDLINFNDIRADHLLKPGQVLMVMEAAAGCCQAIGTYPDI